MKQPSIHSKAVAWPNIAHVFQSHGWDVEPEPHSGLSAQRPDFIIHKGALKYAVQFKWVSEGRPDRVLAAFSFAILQARRYAADQAAKPLAVVWVAHASELLLQKIREFKQQLAPDTAIGLVTGNDMRYFEGAGLEGLNNKPKLSPLKKGAEPSNIADLFSDLNQWMLKVLLAPELPKHLLTAPRGEYRSASALADAARVSLMSASRFVRSLRNERFLDDSSGSLRLVRRAELFRRWQAASMKSSGEIRMQFVLPASGAKQFGAVAKRLDGCVGLFAAAEYLHVSHVSGVIPYVFVRHLARLPEESLHGLRPSGPGEPVHLILKKANAPESLFRGSVVIDGINVSDVLQLWLDLSGHPSRGAEQIDYLQRNVLQSILSEY